MRYRPCYLDRTTDLTARFAWMTRPDALEIARQLQVEGEQQIQIEDESGQHWSIEGLAGS
jgi:hypothetical protein